MFGNNLVKSRKLLETSTHRFSLPLMMHIVAHPSTSGSFARFLFLHGFHSCVPAHKAWTCSTSSSGTGCKTCKSQTLRTATNDCASCNDGNYLSGTSCQAKLYHIPCLGLTNPESQTPGPFRLFRAPRALWAHGRMGPGPLSESLSFLDSQKVRN